MANGILDNQLPNSELGLQGQTPGIRPGARIDSTLHNQSSLNNQPGINQVPSSLDLNGLTPDKYLDNPPN
jgi:hypothetical protein|tara:strand:- start:410 stop:619 length:210 start_codon:yes stop_codon:yes gene_type:complete